MTDGQQQSNDASVAPTEHIDWFRVYYFIMKIFKSVLYNDKAFGKGDPTPKDFKVAGTYKFESEREKYLQNLNEIFNKGAKGNYKPHVFFGKITDEQWGMHFYKHTDHHLRQFGV